MIKHVVSVSGGKDSAATLLIALENCPRDSIVPIFCDTGMAATFIPAPGITPSQAKDNTIWHVVEWAKTTRGGKQFNLLAGLENPTACASAYGLCE